MATEPDTGQTALGRALEWLHRAEDGVLGVLLLGMLALAVTQIALRNFADTSLVWADPLLRSLVLWVGLLGAVAATRGNEHITIDVLTQVLSSRARRWTSVLVHAVTAVVCAIIAYYGSLLVTTYADPRATTAGLPSYVLQAIVPVSFGLMALRYLLHTALAVRAVAEGGTAA